MKAVTLRGTGNNEVVVNLDRMIYMRRMMGNFTSVAMWHGGDLGFTTLDVQETPSEILKLVSDG